MNDAISAPAIIELRKRLAEWTELWKMELLQHQPYAIRHGKLIPGIDLSHLIEEVEPAWFSAQTTTSTQHFGVFWPGAKHSSENALGLTSVTTVHRWRTLTAARGAPFTVTTAVTDGSSEKNTTFWWVQENVRFWLLRALWKNTHGHIFFPHLVMKLQNTVGNLPLAYYPSEFEEHITSLDHEDFEKVVGLRRVFLLLYWAKLAEKKWLLTRQSDGRDYLFSHYQTLPSEIRKSGITV